MRCKCSGLFLQKLFCCKWQCHRITGLNAVGLELVHQAAIQIAFCRVFDKKGALGRWVIKVISHCVIGHCGIGVKLIDDG